MDADIDNFIRAQKSKIATERQYLSNQNLSNKIADSSYKYDSGNLKNYNSQAKKNFSSVENFVFKMGEGENMKNKYKQELRNEFNNLTDLNKRLEMSSRRESFPKDYKTDHGGSLPGLSDSNSDTQRKEQLRNQEYNEFKKIDELNFRNRFSDKKTVQFSAQPMIRSQNSSSIPWNPITPSNNNYESSTSQKKINISRSPSPQNYYVARNTGNSVESKLDELEKKVEDLRQFRIQEYPQIMPNIQTEPSGLSTLKPHLRSLAEMEKQLFDMDQKYYDSKSKILKTYRSGPVKKISTILDDESILEQGTIGKLSNNFSSNKSTNQNSIIPFGRAEDEATKRKRQEQYRKDLQNQMKEKSQKYKQNDFNSNENISFFDRFGSNDDRKVKSSRPRDARISDMDKDKENDYLYYATRNPLDDLENNNYIPTSFDIRTSPSTAKINDNILGYQFESGKTFITSSNQVHKDSYGEELKKQIEERRIRKEVDRKRLEEYERRKNEEISNYDPFGRGGGGAPLKDSRGETIANLKNIRFDNTFAIPPSSYRAPVDYYQELSKPFSISPPIDSAETKTHARGGHGIFGQALSEEDKMKAERYKDELKTQMEMKRKQKELDKEKEMVLEAKEREKFERDQRQIQLELENERKIQQQKEIDRLQRLEESKLAAKERKSKEQMKINVEEPIKRPSPIPFVRDRSSPVPIGRERLIFRETPKPRTPLMVRDSVTVQMNRDTNEITNKLHLLKNQIINQSAQLELDIARQSDEVEIYDPRLARARHVDNSNNLDYNSNIFQSVLDNKGPLSVRRGHFKPKSSTTRHGVNTEAFLDEHLKQQEKVLERMGHLDFSPLELTMQRMNPRDLGIRPQTEMSNQLESESNFITNFNQSRDFGLKSSLSDISDENFRFSKNRSPRKFKLNNEMGSNTSLNIDDLTRKNKQRLRKLQRTQLENDRNQSPDDILNKIASSDNHLFNY